MNQNFNNPPLPNPSPKKTPQQLTREIVAWVKGAITVTTWLVLLIVALGAGYLAIRGMLIAVQQLLRALGI